MTRSSVKENMDENGRASGQEVFNIFARAVKKPTSEMHKQDRRSKRKIVQELQCYTKRKQAGDEILIIQDQEEKKTQSKTKSKKHDEGKKTTRIQLHGAYVPEIDHAPFSSLHVTCPLRITDESEHENWSIPQKTAQKQQCMSIFRHSLSIFPLEAVADCQNKLTFDGSTEQRPILTSSQSEQERSWYSWAESCKQLAHTIPWCDALRPTLTGRWIGDADSATSVKHFVSRWKRKVIREEKEVVVPKSRRRRKDSDSDYECEEGDEGLANPLILCGTSGSGKTSLISAVSDELGMKILEVHPGEKRSATSLKAKLAGAIQTHRVQCTGGLTNFFSPKSSDNHERPIERKQTLIVVEHVDVFFEDDKDYFSTLKSLAAESKVPMIWTCERVPRQEMNREPVMSYELVHISQNSNQQVARYARMCVLALAGINIPTDILLKLAELKNGHLRAILNDLQFQTSSKEDMFLLLEKIATKKKTRLPEDWNRSTVAVAPDRQYAIKEKKKQHREIIRSVEGPLRHPANHNYGYDFSNGYRVLHSINPVGYQVRPIAVDYVPYLAHMNHTEKQRRETNGRRYQHYFAKVDKEAECSIDMTGDLILALHSFNFDRTPYVREDEPHSDEYTLTQL